MRKLLQEIKDQHNISGTSMLQFCLVLQNIVKQLFGKKVLNTVQLNHIHVIHLFRTNYENLHIFFGAYDFDKIDTSLVQLRSIRKIITHPNFVRKTFNNDIAIIELNSSVLFSGPIGPACLPESGNVDSFRMRKRVPLREKFYLATELDTQLKSQTALDKVECIGWRMNKFRVIKHILLVYLSKQVFLSGYFRIPSNEFVFLSYRVQKLFLFPRLWNTFSNTNILPF